MFLFFFIVWMHLVVVCWPVQADIFKINDENPAPLRQAADSDSRGQYYRHALDDDLTSSFSGPFEFRSVKVKKKASRQVDLQASIPRQISSMFKTTDLNALMGQVQASPLMLWQYSSPAAVDLLKHYHTIAHFKLAMMYTDLKDLEKGLAVDLDFLRDQAEMDCIKEKLTRGNFELDAVDLMHSCRNSDRPVFADLNFAGFEVFERVVNRFNLRGKAKEDMLQILPKWQLGTDQYDIFGPSKRIGQVFAELRKEFLQHLSDLVQEYRHSKTSSEEAREDFALPGIPFTEQNVRDLSAMPQEQQWMLMGQLASQRAYLKTTEVYDTAIEWLRRTLHQPTLEEAYKNVVRKGVAFLEEERSSLEEQRRRARATAGSRHAMHDAIQAEKMHTVLEQKKSRAKAQEGI